MKRKRITKDMLLADVVRKYPQTIEVFLKYGLPCAMCHIAYNETIEQGAASHGINLKSLLKELNEVISKK
jgi:hybrid cluster-associated redox disulfide protein